MEFTRGNGNVHAMMMMTYYDKVKQHSASWEISWMFTNICVYGPFFGIFDVTSATKLELCSMMHYYQKKTKPCEETCSSWNMRVNRHKTYRHTRTQTHRQTGCNTFHLSHWRGKLKRSKMFQIYSFPFLPIFGLLNNLQISPSLGIQLQGQKAQSEKLSTSGCIAPW